MWCRSMLWTEQITQLVHIGRAGVRMAQARLRNGGQEVRHVEPAQGGEPTQDR